MSLSTPRTATSGTTTSSEQISSSSASNSSEQKTVMPSHIDQARTGPTPRFCVVCCEETEATQEISKEVAKWNLPGVRSLLLSSESAQSPINEYRHNIPSFQADAVARSEYAIFITPSAQPCSQIRVNPLNKVCSHRRPSQASPERQPAKGQLAKNGSAQSTYAQNHPSTLLTALHNCHGQSPQAWWLQLPTTEVRAKSTQPISCQKSVAQALNQIGIFVRNYQGTVALQQASEEAVNSAKKSVAVKSVATKTMAADKVAITH